ncbi:MAG: hypothetical protein WA842_13610 [Croceibacterium sp.]
MPASLSFALRLFSASWGQVVSAIVSLLALSLYTAGMGPDSFGAAMLALGALSLCDGVGALAFAPTLANLLKDYDDRVSRIALALSLAGRFWRWMLVVGVAGALAAILYFGLRQSLILLPLIALFTATEGLRVAGQTIAMLERRYMVLSGWNAADALITLGASLALIRLTDGAPDALVAGALCSRIVTTLLFIQPAIGRAGQWQFDPAGARALQKRAMAYGWTIAAMGPIAWLGLFADRYIVGATLGMAEAGVLAAIAGAVARPYGIVSASLTNLFRPDLLDQAAGRPPHHARPLATWIAAAVAIGLLGLGGLAVIGQYLADFLIAFPTPEIDEWSLLVIIGLSQTLVLVTHALDNSMLARGSVRTMLALQTSILICGLPLIAGGALMFGVTGAAWGRAANEGLRVLGAALFLLWVRKVRNRQQLAIPQTTQPNG